VQVRHDRPVLVTVVRGGGCGGGCGGGGSSGGGGGSGRKV